MVCLILKYCITHVYKKTSLMTGTEWPRYHPNWYYYPALKLLSQARRQFHQLLLRGGKKSHWFRSLPPVGFILWEHYTFRSPFINFAFL